MNYPLTLNIVISIVILIGAMMSLVRQMQMLQQNSYFPSRYLKWVKINSTTSLIIPLIFGVFACLGCFFKGVFGTISAIISAFFIIIYGINSININKNSIKKLVFTARVKRMFIAAGIVEVVLAILYCLNICGYVFYLVSALPVLLTLIVRYLTAPVEKIINNYYTNDAKKILKSMPHLKVVGVTGSYGKTSTKYILGRVLNEKFNTVITPESFNTPMGVIRTVREKITPATEVFVAEMGAKNVGDIKEICKIANPSMAVITSVGLQHLETFKNIENVTKTKFELADWVAKNEGKIFLNTDNIYIKNKSSQYSCISYGTANSDYLAKNISYNKDGLSLTIEYNGKEIELKSKLLGYHNALNIAASVAVALELNIPEKQICYAVSQLKPTAHRLEMKRYINGCVLIDDAYNSNPEGCLEAVNVLGSFNGMKKIIVTPGLIELGDREYECNFNLGKKAAEYCDIIILVGKKRSQPIANGVKEHGFAEENLYVVDSFMSAVGLLNEMCDSNTAVLFENDLPDNYLM